MHVTAPRREDTHGGSRETQGLLAISSKLQVGDLGRGAARTAQGKENARAVQEHSFLPLPELHHLLSLPSSTSFRLTTLPQGVARLPARVPSSPHILNAHSSLSLPRNQARAEQQNWEEAAANSGESKNSP